MTIILWGTIRTAVHPSGAEFMFTDGHCVLPGENPGQKSQMQSL